MPSPKPLNTLIVETLIKAARVVSFITAALFLIGYVYLQTFYGAFNLTIETLDLPFWSILISSLSFFLRALELLFELPMGRFLVASLGFLASVPVCSWVSDKLFERVRFRGIPEYKFVANFSFLLLSGLLLSKFAFNIQPAALAPYLCLVVFGPLPLINRWRLGIRRSRPTAVYTRVDQALGGFVRIYWISLVALFMVVFLLFVPFAIGRRLATIERLHPSTKIKLFLKRGEEQVFGEDVFQANKTDNLRLLVQTKDLLVVYIPGQTPPSAYPSLVRISSQSELRQPARTN